jgi:hypothetical protein
MGRRCGPSTGGLYLGQRLLWRRGTVTYRISNVTNDDFNMGAPASASTLGAIRRKWAAAKGKGSATCLRTKPFQDEYATKMRNVPPYQRPSATRVASRCANLETH